MDRKWSKFRTFLKPFLTDETNIMHTLFIQPLTADIELSIFHGKTYTKTINHPKNGKELDTLPELLISIIEDEQIEEIWCITGPGPFTLMRIITLVLNTIHISRDIGLKSASFFDWIKTSDIAILEANPREYIIQKEAEFPILVEKESLEKSIYEGFFHKNDFTEAMGFIEYTQDMSYTSKFFETK
jgi:hypothetical protein